MERETDTVPWNEELAISSERTPPPLPRPRNWLWRPWYAKLWWALTALYWIGLYVLLLVPDEKQNYYAANTMILLIFVFNPITVLALLGRGFLHAKVACGDWIIVPGARRKPMIDPYLDPSDVRSGIFYRRHIDAAKHLRH